MLSEEQAVTYVYGGDAAAVANAVCFALGLASTRSAGADAVAEWALARADEDPALVAFSASLDVLAWQAVTILRGERRAA